jgi:hypothetical protein
MIRFGRPALAVAAMLLLGPLASEVRTTTTEAESAGIELVRGGGPTYAPRASARPGRTCYAGHGLYTAGGHRHH